MSITQQEKTLFAAWAEQLKQDGLDFVKDGVVCEDAYARSDPKILFVLKEPNGDNDGDIRNWMSGGGNTWMPIARWTHGIRHRMSLPKWEEIYEQWCSSKDQRAAILQDVCAINLKKSSGGGSTEDEEIKKFTGKYKEKLQRQYELYNPDLTICCGKHVSSWVRDTMEHNGDWKTTNRGAWWYQRSTNKYVIDYTHPAARTSARLVFYDLIDTVNEIYGNA